MMTDEGAVLSVETFPLQHKKKKQKQKKITNQAVTSIYISNIIYNKCKVSEEQIDACLHIGIPQISKILIAEQF